VLCCVVLCCVVLCCVVLCCVVFCFVVLCYVMLCYVVLCYVVLDYGMCLHGSICELKIHTVATTYSSATLNDIISYDVIPQALMVAVDPDELLKMYSKEEKTMV
jgi:hypothetical protein